MYFVMTITDVSEIQEVKLNKIPGYLQSLPFSSHAFMQTS